MKKKIIIIGGGFAGIQLARKLNTDEFEILLIDKLNHHQFQPLFYQVATSQLEPSSISFPLRNIFKRQKNIQIRVAEVRKIHPSTQEVETSIGNFKYDELIIATGCRTNFFGNPRLEEHTYTLKSTYDAIAIRNHILSSFEKIISASGPEKEALLNLVIVGAGPTGVELAGAFAEIKKNILPKDYPGIDFSRLSIYLLEGSPHPLNNMSEKAKTAATRYLLEMGVQLLTGKMVKDYNGHTLLLCDGQEIPSSTVIWAAGVKGNFIEGIPNEVRMPGERMRVERNNQVEGLPHVYAIGDIAYMPTPKYPKGHPQVANVAINQAKLLASNLKRAFKKKAPLPFEYKDLGSMATIGTNKAVVDLPFIQFTGYIAWLVWMFLHLMLILSVKNKLIIFINWAWAYVTKDTSLRLILKPAKPEELESS